MDWRKQTTDKERKLALEDEKCPKCKKPMRVIYETKINLVGIPEYADKFSHGGELYCEKDHLSIPFKD